MARCDFLYPPLRHTEIDPWNHRRRNIEDPRQFTIGETVCLRNTFDRGYYTGVTRVTQGIYAGQEPIFWSPFGMPRHFITIQNEQGVQITTKVPANDVGKMSISASPTAMKKVLGEKLKMNENNPFIVSLAQQGYGKRRKTSRRSRKMRKTRKTRRV